MDEYGSCHKFYGYGPITYSMLDQDDREYVVSRMIRILFMLRWDAKAWDDSKIDRYNRAFDRLYWYVTSSR